MKKGNLYKLEVIFMALLMISTLSFAQNKGKEDKKEKTYIIKMEVNDEGEITEIDSIVFATPYMNIDSLMEEIEVNMEITKDRMKEIHIELKGEMSEVEKVIKMELKKANEELVKAFEILQKELEKLEIESEVRQRIDEAIKTIEESDLRNLALVEKFIMEDAHPMFFHEDSNVEYIIEGKDTTEVYTSVVRMGGEEYLEHHYDSDVNVWVEEDGETKVIIKKAGRGKEVISYEGEEVHEHGNKQVMVKKIVLEEASHAGMMMIHSANEMDFEKAMAAGLPLKEEQRLEEMEVNVNIDGDKNPLIGFRTGEKGKMKATIYDESFKKVKSLKLTENDGMHEFILNKEEFKESNGNYLLIEQNNKADLMKLK